MTVEFSGDFVWDQVVSPKWRTRWDTPGLSIFAQDFGWIWGVSVSQGVWAGYGESGWVAFLRPVTGRATRLGVLGGYGVIGL